MIARALLLAATVAFSGCSSPTSPTRSLFRTGQDARVYNPMTGRYEWPEEPVPAQRVGRASESAIALRNARETSSPTPGAGDERTYNPQSGRFEPPR